MNIEIKNRFTGEIILCGEYESIKECLEKNRYANLSYADLRSANLSYADLSYANLSYADLRSANLSYANLRYANLSYADLSYANLRYANLRYANLSYADLSYADLSYADLRYANLRYANLSYADLSYAKNFNRYRSEPLLFLRDQPGKIRAYKLVDANGESPMCRNNGAIPITYKMGETVTVPDANTNESELCAAGVNLATLDWCMREWRQGYRILLAEFEADDIAAIPIGTDGKFRVHRCTIVGEKDLKEIGLI